MGRQESPVRFEVLGRLMVVFVGEHADAEHIGTTASLIASIATNYGIDEVRFDMHDVATLDASTVQALRDAAARLDDKGVMMRVRRPSASVRAALADAEMNGLIAGY